MKRRLVLRREALTDLSAAELGGVAGAAEWSGATCPEVACAVVSVLTRCPAYCPHTFPWC